MSSAERRFSLTLSEDDLRPHMRKPKPRTPKPDVVASPASIREVPRSIPSSESSEIEALRLKYEKREEVKKEVKRRVEEEEKAREQRKREEEMRKELEQLWKGQNQNNQNPGGRRSESRNNPLGLPKLGRRFNDSQYFKWDSVDEIPTIPEEFVPRPASRRDFSPIPRAPSSESCELCTLARRAIEKSGSLTVPTKSAACAHVDAFVSGRNNNF